MRAPLLHGGPGASIATVTRSERRKLARELGNAIREARGSRTQEDVATKARLHKSQLCRIEGGVEPRLFRLCEIAESLGVPVLDLLSKNSVLSRRSAA